MSFFYRAQPKTRVSLLASSVSLYLSFASTEMVWAKGGPAQAHFRSVCSPWRGPDIGTTSVFKCLQLASISPAPRFRNCRQK